MSLFRWVPRFTFKRVFRAGAATLLLGLSGCSTLGYLLQAGKGQLSLWNRARPIDEVVRDPRTSPRLKRLLGEIPRIKSFGESRGLKATSNYRRYVQLDRPAVVWVVSASERLRFKPKEWSFPLVGGFTYLGWFDRADAEKYGASLRADWDVDVRGASAYSTLGWFTDPILSTMIADGDEAFGELVNVVLHESLHATTYVKGQSYFNESLASFVADGLTPLYLAAREGLSDAERQAYAGSERSQRERAKEYQAAYRKLSDLYASSRPEEEKLQEKARIYAELKERLKSRRELNNASLIQFRTYGVGEKEFTDLFAACGNDWGRFLRAVAPVTAKDFAKPQQEEFAEVTKKLGAGCGG